MKEVKTLSFSELEKLLEGVLRPGRYVGNEIGIKNKDINKIKSFKSLVLASLVFPDLYEVGMSNLGIQILYDLINKHPKFSAERVFSPWVDFENNLRKTRTKIFSLESRIFLDEFDIIGFSLQHELQYTNVLNILNLGGLELHSLKRGDSYPIICAGGPAAFNPLPMAAFIDFFVIGDGEKVFIDILEVLLKVKENNKTKRWFLEQIKDFDGVFIPGLYKFLYFEDGRINKIEPDKKVKKAVVKDINEFRIVTDPVIPNIKPIHDRYICEIMRGCYRGCRFCQAGFIYRPVRVRKAEKLIEDCIKGIENSGFDEISFLSLSSADYPKLDFLINSFLGKIKNKKISISLPSLRLDSFNFSIAELIQSGRKTGLTFAPEAGSQRMRDIIKKDINKDEMLDCIKIAFERGWEKIKLYFMIGLPYETKEDILGISEIVYEIIDLGKRILPKNKRQRLNINLSINAFCPKPFTPFQWNAQDPIEVLKEKFSLLLTSMPKKYVNVSYSDLFKSKLECAISRGNYKVSEVIELAYQHGAKFDNWSEMFNPSVWERAFIDANLDINFFTEREMGLKEVLPWDFIDIGIEKDFFLKENLDAKQSKDI